MVGLGHDSRLASDGITHHAKTGFGADDESEETIEIIERTCQCFAQILALGHFRREIGGGHFRVVLGFEGHAFAHQFTAQIIVVGERTIVHQALVGARGKGMRAKRRHCRFRCHAGVTDAVAAGHGTHVETGDDILRQAGFLIDFHTVAGTHHPHIRPDGG